MKDKHIERVKAIIAQCQKDGAEVLDLSYQGLLNSDLPMLIDAIGKNPNIQRINFSHNHLSRPLALVKAINQHPNIEAVNLSHNGSYYQEMAKVIDGLAKNVKLVEFDVDLSINYVGKSTEWSQHYVHKLRNFLKRNQIIKKIVEDKHKDASLRFSDLCADDVVAISEALLKKGVDWLRAIDLSDCNLCITDKSLVALGRLVEANKGLKIIHMANNNVRTNAIASFKNFLERCGVRFVFHGALTPSVRGVDIFDSNLRLEHIHFRNELRRDILYAELRAEDVVPSDRRFALRDLSYFNFDTKLYSYGPGLVADRLQHYYGETDVSRLAYFIFPKNMQRSNFHRSSFLYAQLSGRNMRKANFSSASLRHADIKNANLSNTNLTGACFYDADLKGSNLTQADARSTDFAKARLSDADLRDANFQYSMFVKANLRATDFRGANLKGVNFTGANLKNANLSGCDLSQTIGLESANLKGAYLYGAKLPKSVWAPTQEDKFKRDVSKILSSMRSKNKLYTIFDKLEKSEKPHFSELSGKELKALHKSYRRRATKSFMKEYDQSIKQTNREKVYKDVYLSKFFDSMGLPDNAQSKIKSQIDELPDKPFLNTKEIRSFN